MIYGAPWPRHQEGHESLMAFPILSRGSTELLLLNTPSSPTKSLAFPTRKQARESC